MYKWCSNLLPLHDENRPLTKPFVNYVIILINVVVFFYFFLQGLEVLEEAVINYGVIPYFILQGKRLWTIITSMFMHAGPLHLFGNMLFLYIFGDNVEDAFGHSRYLIFYILSGLGATIVHMLTIPFDPYVLIIPAVGASGAISGVLGAYMILYPRARIKVLVFTPYLYGIYSLSSYYFIGFWFLQQLYFGMFSLTGIPTGTAYWAHIGGFITGMILVKLFKVRPRLYRRPYYPTYPRVYRVPVT